MEILDILDKNGNPTGKTMRKGDPIVNQEGIWHLGADVWIINSENKILIQKRSPNKRNEPNVWAMTGGSVRRGESSLDTIKRETLEELGVELNVENAIRIYHYRIDNIWLDVFVVYQDVNLEDVVLQPEELTDVKFATFDEVEKIYQDSQFIKNRWEFVREKIKNYIEKAEYDIQR